MVSRYRESLDQVAQNRKGQSSLTFTIVVLGPDNHNAADPNAVAITTQQKPYHVLGYLPREQAATYRTRMQEAGYEHLISACEMVLSAGLVTADCVYDYILELDLDMSEDPSPDHLVVHPELVRLPADPEFKKDASGAYRFKCWLPHDAVGEHHARLRTKGWTTDSWNTVNYYLCNRQGLGLGFKLLSVPKAKHAKALGDKPATAIVEDITRRWVTLKIEP